ncbi:glycosyltransferase [Flavobacterium myungsuense]|uniref:Glycosyltransferase n=1 Tax=Flavobacterium myungsuense TaxID=651823 RepID=A0ABW3IZX0_9FLAO
MKVLHINTIDFGGAATAAIRLHNALLENDIESSFLTIKKSETNIINHIIVPNHLVKLKLNETFSLKKYLKIKFDRNYGKYLTEVKRKRIIRHLGNITNRGVISFPNTEFDELHLLSEISKADIIHLHWVADFIDYSTFFKNVTKPIVWTFHDENAFLGIFHYSGDKVSNKENELKKIDEEVYLLKKNTLKDFKNLHVVTPSKWLGSLAANSEIFNNFNVSIIPYSLNLNVFKIQNKEFAREVFNLPTNKKIALFVAESVTNERKGFDLLSGAFEKIVDKEDLLLVAIGNVSATNKQENVKYLGSINDERLMALAYAAADVFILPSREDNLPNTMLESLSCGTPIIGFPIGGIKETIENGFNGYLCPELSIDGLYETIEKFFQNISSFNSDKISKAAHDKFNNKKQASSYITIYKKLIPN